MKRLALVLPLLIVQPAFAEEPADPGPSLMEQGMQLMLKGLMTEMAPAFDEMDKALKEAQPLLQDLGPKFAELLTLMGDLSNYETPVVLPNGDILIRRKPDPPVPLEPKPGVDGEVEL
ncbi:MAG: hypothetical protein WAT09_04940 [Paracoccaceae bacterium]